VILVDTSVLIDILQNDPDWAQWSVSALAQAEQRDELVINDVIYAEVSTRFEQLEDVDRVVSEFGVRLERIPREALFLAGKAFLRYRRSGGTKTGVLSDFFIGAHSAVERWPLLTRDAGRVRTYFPTVNIVEP